jgi:hypothetical protein
MENCHERICNKETQLNKSQPCDVTQGFAACTNSTKKITKPEKYVILKNDKKRTSQTLPVQEEKGQSGYLHVSFSRIV